MLKLHLISLLLYLVLLPFVIGGYQGTFVPSSIVSGSNFVKLQVCGINCSSPIVTTGGLCGSTSCGVTLTSFAPTNCAQILYCTCSFSASTYFTFSCGGASMVSTNSIPTIASVPTMTIPQFGSNLPPLLSFGRTALPSSAALNFTGSALCNSASCYLTPALGGQSGTATFSQPVMISSQSSFSVTLLVSLTACSGCADGFILSLSPFFKVEAWFYSKFLTLYGPNDQMLAGQPFLALTTSTEYQLKLEFNGTFAQASLARSSSPSQGTFVSMTNVAPILASCSAAQPCKTVLSFSGWTGGASAQTNIWGFNISGILDWDVLLPQGNSFSPSGPSSFFHISITSPIQGSPPLYVPFSCLVRGPDFALKAPVVRKQRQGGGKWLFACRQWAVMYGKPRASVVADFVLVDGAQRELQPPSSGRKFVNTIASVSMVSVA